MLTQTQAQSISESIASVKRAAATVKASLEERNGEQYDLADVETVLIQWFLDSADQLALEAHYHAISGDRSYAFNRSTFDKLAARLEPIEQPELVAA